MQKDREVRGRDEGRGEGRRERRGERGEEERRREGKEVGSIKRDKYGMEGVRGGGKEEGGSLVRNLKCPPRPWTWSLKNFSSTNSSIPPTRGRNSGPVPKNFTTSGRPSRFRITRTTSILGIFLGGSRVEILPRNLWTRAFYYWKCPTRGELIIDGVHFFFFIFFAWLTGRDTHGIFDTCFLEMSDSWRTNYRWGTFFSREFSGNHPAPYFHHCPWINFFQEITPPQ
jgi:hypothetical protein